VKTPQSLVTSSLTLVRTRPARPGWPKFFLFMTRSSIHAITSVRTPCRPFQLPAIAAFPRVLIVPDLFFHYFSLDTDASTTLPCQRRPTLCHTLVFSGAAPSRLEIMEIMGVIICWQTNPSPRCPPRKADILFPGFPCLHALAVALISGPARSPEKESSLFSPFFVSRSLSSCRPGVSLIASVYALCPKMHPQVFI